MTKRKEFDLTDAPASDEALAESVMERAHELPCPHCALTAFTTRWLEFDKTRYEDGEGLIRGLIEITCDMAASIEDEAERTSLCSELTRLFMREMHKVLNGTYKQELIITPIAPSSDRRH